MVSHGKSFVTGFCRDAKFAIWRNLSPLERLGGTGQAQIQSVSRGCLRTQENRWSRQNKNKIESVTSSYIVIPGQRQRQKPKMHSQCAPDCGDNHCFVQWSFPETNSSNYILRDFKRFEEKKIRIFDVCKWGAFGMFCWSASIQGSPVQARSKAFETRKGWEPGHEMTAMAETDKIRSLEGTDFARLRGVNVSVA
jgi:hypothetical protein